MSTKTKALLKAEIDSKVTENGSNQITGEKLNDVLNDMVDSLCDGTNFDEGSIPDAALENPVSVSQNISIDNDDAASLLVGDTEYNVRDLKAYDLSYSRETGELLGSTRWRFARKVIQGHSYYIKHLSGDLLKIYTTQDDSTTLTTNEWVLFTAATTNFLYMYSAAPVNAPTIDIVSVDGVIDELMRIEAKFPIIRPTMTLQGQIGIFDCNVLAGHTYFVRRVSGSAGSFYRESADLISSLTEGVWYSWTPTSSGKPRSYFSSTANLETPQMEIVSGDSFKWIMTNLDNVLKKASVIDSSLFFDSSADIDAISKIHPELISLRSLQALPNDAELYIKYCCSFASGLATDFLIRVVDENGNIVSQRNGGLTQTSGIMVFETSGAYRFKFVIDLDKAIIPQSGYLDFTTKLPLNISYLNAQVYDNRISNKSVVCFGDSVTEFSYNGMRYSDYISDMLLLNTINMGVGGSKLRQTVNVDTSTNEYQKAVSRFDVVNLIKAVYEEDYTALLAAAEYLDDYTGGGSTRYSDIANRLISIDWNTVGAVTIFAGTNDWSAKLGRGNIGTVDSTDINLTLGAVNEIIRMMSEKFPTIKIYWISPIIRYDIPVFEDSESYVIGDVVYRSGAYYVFISNHTGAWDSSDVESITPEEARQDRYFGDNLSFADYTLKQLSAKIGEVATKNHIPFCDLYNTLGWNKWNFSAFFNDYDTTHPYKGFNVLGERISAFIKSKQ